MKSPLIFFPVIFLCKFCITLVINIHVIVFQISLNVVIIMSKISDGNNRNSVQLVRLIQKAI